MQSLFKRIVTGIVAIAFVAAAMPVVSTSAEAGHRYHRGSGYYGHYDRGYYGPRNYSYRHYKRHRNRAAIAGITGFALGTIVGSTIAQPRYYYQRPYRSYGYIAYRPRPWTSDWYAYCASKYRSFDPRSGTFQPYHGRRRLCR